jgi:hypothetical protein
MPARITSYTTTLPTTRPGWRRILGSGVSAVLHVVLVVSLILWTRGRPSTPGAERAREAVARPIQLVFAPPRPTPTPRPSVAPAPPPAVPLTPGPDADPGTTARVAPQPEQRPNAAPGTAASDATRPDPGEAKAPLASNTSALPPPPALAAPSELAAAQPEKTLESEAQRIFGRPSSKLGPIAGSRDNRPWESPVDLNSRGCTVPEDSTDSSLPKGMAMIAGRIYNQHTGQPLAGARLQILGTAYGAFANEHGDYKLYFDRSLVNRCRSQSVRVSAPGYQQRDVQLYIGVTPNGDVPLSRY